MHALSQEKIYTDVLVIGGGLAGLTAALEAKSNNVDVTIVSKGKAGKSGNSIIAGAGMSALDTDPEDSAELFYKDVIESGKEINDRQLVKFFVRNSTEEIDKLSKYGVIFKKNNNHLVRKRPPGHSVSRFVHSDYYNFPYVGRGLSITLPLLSESQKRGIKIVDNTSIIKLLVSPDHRVYGAIGINKKVGKIFVFYTNVIILASGGGGGIFSKSNNTSDITSDSYSLAYDAGALLRDMEFAQFYPSMMYKPIRTGIANAIFGEGAILRNSLGESFMEKYDKAGNMATRDVMSRAIFTEILKGRGINGSVFMDLRSISKSVFEDKYTELYENLRKKGIDYKKDLLSISPVYHFFIGGIVINTQAETTLEGLLACGEAVGGLHGANRLTGNALSEAVVFGIIAGKTAAKAAKVKNNISLSFDEVEHFRQGKLSTKELKIRLSQTMWRYASILRDRDSLEKAKEEIDLFSNFMDNVSINDISELLLFYELKSMLTTSRLVLEGALLRKESRGAHYRTDYPDIDNANFKGNYYSKKVNGKLSIYFKSI